MGLFNFLTFGDYENDVQGNENSSASVGEAFNLSRDDEEFENIEPDSL